MSASTVDGASAQANQAQSDQLRDVAVVVGPGRSDIGPEGPVHKARQFGLDPDRVVEYRLVHIRSALSERDLETLIERLVVDPVDSWWMFRSEHKPPTGQGTVTVVESGLRPGVTDREGAELRRAAGLLGLPIEAAALAKRWLVFGELNDVELETLAERVLHNTVIERWATTELAPSHTDSSAKAPATETVALAGLNQDELTALSQARRLGLTTTEMEAIQAHFAVEGREPNDGELETLAQTWSEHCSHKTFGALIDTPEGEIDGLLNTFIRAATTTIDAPWVESSFVDNAGIVHFDDEYDLALKAETHNHPSALEPFGGANTGVGGVVRDILGVSAKPIAITDILCFGPEDVEVADLPPGVLHPSRIRSGVIAGVGDYGNKIGVPNLAGAILHDPGFTTTPLVFAGCVGILPRGSNPTNAKPGDAIVVLGGAVGRDGVGGATFSSQSMGVETADIAGSSVQIGDPVVEKGLIDLVLAAREAKLYNAITDCGAGGLSSAVGEMAEKLGAEVDLQTVPRKYPGLAPWEVWLSEAQERMVLAVPNPVPLLELAELWQVEAAVIGHFTGQGRLVVTDGSDPLVDLDCRFLHDGRPRLHLQADHVDPQRPERSSKAEGVNLTANEATLKLLAHPSLRSNEDVIRTYDHEVLGGTVIRPFDGVSLDGPADGTALVPPGTDSPDSGPTRAMTIGIGAAPLVGRHDCEAMAWSAVDEAVRNAVIGGADPDQLSLLDNFAWGNPNDPVTLGRLVAACRGCHDAAVAHGAPFVSGKDSLYNEFVHPDGTRDPVTATLIITAVGIARDIAKIPVVGVSEVGNDIWLVGREAGCLGGSYLDEVTGVDRGGELPGSDRSVAIEAVGNHRQVADAIAAGLVVSAHDVSEGGIAVAAAEWAFAGRLGVELEVENQPEVLFGEELGRYLIEARPESSEQLAQLVPGIRRIGQVVDAAEVRVGEPRDPAVALSIDEIAEAYTGQRLRNPAADSPPEDGFDSAHGDTAGEES